MAENLLKNSFLYHHILKNTDSDSKRDSLLRMMAREIVLNHYVIDTLTEDVDYLLQKLGLSGDSSVSRGNSSKYDFFSDEEVSKILNDMKIADTNETNRVCLWVARPYDTDVALIYDAEQLVDGKSFVCGENCRLVGESDADIYNLAAGECRMITYNV